MKKRTFPAALRFNKPRFDTNPEKFILHELQLYKPFTEEFKDEEVLELYEETTSVKDKNGKITEERKVDLVKAQVMEHLESVSEARYALERSKAMTEDKLREETQRLMGEKELYQETAKETLKKLVDEKLEAVKKQKDGLAKV